MQIFKCLNLLILLVCLHFPTIISSSCSVADRAALLGFKSSVVKDSTQILSSWQGRDCCNGDWEGVECDPSSGRVLRLVLQRPADKDLSMFMKGTLSSTLGSLQFLEVMVISGLKRIGGPIPESFSNLKRLTQLILEDNFLQGHIPSSLGTLPLLQTLSLSGNFLSGQIPPELGSLRNLQQFSASRNSLTGPIPATFKNLIHLESFDLGFNALSGSIPGFVGSFQNLTYLILTRNQFSGGIPSSLGSLRKLSEMSLGENLLVGQIPSQMGNLKSLSILALDSNKLTGQIPESISQLPNLWNLSLSRNVLVDPLPRTFAKGLPSLLSIDLSYNKFNFGIVPRWITDRELSYVHLAGCNLRGTLPQFTRPDSLTSIDLSDNFFTDGIDRFFEKMTSLDVSKISNNQLKSDVSAIKLPGGIVDINLHANRLYGSLAGILNNSTSKFLEAVDVSSNQISGTIPEFGTGTTFSNLKVLNIGNNKIGGQIPSSISNLGKLERLDISRNDIAGTIPTSLGSLTNLQWLDLSINKLIGKIPDSLLKIKSLRHASFRANRLCGEIPQARPLNVFQAVAYAHNLCLCGKPLPPCKVRKTQRKLMVKMSQ